MIDKDYDGWSIRWMMNNVYDGWRIKFMMDDGWSLWWIMDQFMMDDG